SSFLRLFEQMTHLSGRDEWSEIVAEVTTTLGDEQNRGIRRQGDKGKRFSLSPCPSSSVANHFPVVRNVWRRAAISFASLGDARPAVISLILPSASLMLLA